jgi:sugar lactone lactonase YvrE
VSNVSSCVFGGPELSELYITTARTGLSEQQQAEQPTAGGIFRARPGVPGTPSVKCRV